MTSPSSNLITCKGSDYHDILFFVEKLKTFICQVLVVCVEFITKKTYVDIEYEKMSNTFLKIDDDMYLPYAFGISSLEKSLGNT